MLSVGISVSDLDRSLQYWSGLLGMERLQRDGAEERLRFGDNQAQLVLHKVLRESLSLQRAQQGLSSSIVTEVYAH